MRKVHQIGRLSVQNIQRNSLSTSIGTIGLGLALAIIHSPPIQQFLQISKSFPNSAKGAQHHAKASTLLATLAEKLYIRFHNSSAVFGSFGTWIGHKKQHHKIDPSPFPTAPRQPQVVAKCNPLLGSAVSSTNWIGVAKWQLLALAFFKIQR